MWDANNKGAVGMMVGMCGFTHLVVLVVGACLRVESGFSSGSLVLSVYGFAEISDI